MRLQFVKKKAVMYFIELIIKKLTHKKEKPVYNPLSESGSEEYEICSHIFMPIDSTNEILSCTKCGLILKRDEIKKKNFFIQDEK